MALLVLTAGCDSATGTSTPADSASSGGASTPAAVSSTPQPASSSPSAPAAAPVAVQTTTQSAPQVQQTQAPAPPPTTQAPQPVQTAVQPQSCTPLTDSGKCYTPGEYCRDDDHGTSGIDADGDTIECVDNDGWRWERE